jgi:hypothetical protein
MQSVEHASLVARVMVELTTQAFCLTKKAASSSMTGSGKAASMAISVNALRGLTINKSLPSRCGVDKVWTNSLGDACGNSRV